MRTRRIPNGLSAESGYHSDKNGHFTRPKNVRRARRICMKCPPYRIDANGSGFARIVVTQQQNSLGYDNEVRLTRHDKGT